MYKIRPATAWHENIQPCNARRESVWLVIASYFSCDRGEIATAQSYLELGSGDADGVAVAWTMMSGRGVAHGVEKEYDRALRCNQFLTRVRECHQNRMGSALNYPTNEWGDYLEDEFWDSLDTAVPILLLFLTTQRNAYTMYREHWR